MLRELQRDAVTSSDARGGKIDSMVRVGSIAVVVAFALSCGSGGGSGLSAAARAKWNDYCAFRASCGDTPCAPVECVARSAESEALIELVDCQTAKTCGASDDECVASAGTTDAERQDFIPRCEAALDVVPASPACYLDSSLCTNVVRPLFRKEIMRAVDACLPIAVCEDRIRCIEAVLQPLSCS